MVKSILIGVTLAAATAAFAQGTIAQGGAQRNCLHAGPESAAERAPPAGDRLRDEGQRGGDELLRRAPTAAAGLSPP